MKKKWISSSSHKKSGKSGRGEETRTRAGAHEYVGPLQHNEVRAENGKIRGVKKSPSICRERKEKHFCKGTPISPCESGRASLQRKRFLNFSEGALVATIKRGEHNVKQLRDFWKETYSNDEAGEKELLGTARRRGGVNPLLACGEKAENDLCGRRRRGGGARVSAGTGDRGCLSFKHYHDARGGGGFSYCGRGSFGSRGNSNQRTGEKKPLSSNSTIVSILWNLKKVRRREGHLSLEGSLEREKKKRSLPRP